MFYLNGLKTAPKHSNGPFWAFRASKTAASRTRRRPKQAQNASDTPESASDTTYIHCYQSHVVPKWPQNRSKPLYGTIWHILGLSRRVIWPLSGPVGVITASTCPKHTHKCFRYHQRASLPVTCCIHTAWKSLKIAQNGVRWREIQDDVRTSHPLLFNFKPFQPNQLEKKHGHTFRKHYLDHL